MTQRSVAALAVVSTIVALASPARAEGPENGDPPSGGCVPACRAGFACVAGQCVSACNPPCAAGESCTAQGQCVAASAAGLCSPPCHAGETCSNGICILEQTTSVQTPYVPQTGYGPGSMPPPMMGHPPTPDPGWALAGGIIGLSSAAAVGILTAIAGGIASADAQDDGPSLTPIYSEGATVNVLGTISIGLVAAMVPVTVAGSGSARDARVRGIPFLRIFGWILYGGALGNGLGLISAANVYDNHFPKWMIATGALGVAALAFQAIDAFVAHAQASSLQASERTPATPPPTAGVRLAPTGGIAPTADGGAAGFLGLSGAF